jgi:hypothetical protein
MAHGHGQGVGDHHHERTPNDQRSDALNPTSHEHSDPQSNHDRQVAENESK